jgi:hypothetical protein
MFHNYIFLPIDHNWRQPAIICPVRLHHYTLKTYIEDTTHFKLLPETTTSASICHIISTKLKELIPFKYLINNRDLTCKVYIILKTDGRVRPIGSYCLAPHKPVLSLASRALNAILTIIPLRHYMLIKSATLKSSISNFNDTALRHNLTIQHTSIDIKDFYTGINKEALKFRLKYILHRYKNHFHTNIISILKQKHHSKSLKLAPIIPGPTTDTRYFSIHIRVLLNILLFALDHAFFQLGCHFIQQIYGLPMGCPTSPPFANLYLAYDEHISSLHSYNLRHPITSHLFVLLVIHRYMDDLDILTASLPSNTNIHKTIITTLQNHTYDQQHKQLRLVIMDTDTFLDSHVIVYNNNKSVKLTYNNKNHDIITSKTQTVGRFHHATTPSHITHKLSGPHAILIKSHDYTSHTHDIMLPAMTIIHELLLLDYKLNQITSILTKTNRSRPNPIWSTISDLISCNHMTTAITDCSNTDIDINDA